MKFRNIKLTIAYDGTEYHGWQKTKEGRSIEEVLENSLQQILQHEVSLQAASRTDAGVHAEGQVVNFFSERNALDLSRLCISLNQILPRDIAVFNCEEVDASFHPTLNATGKIYHYYVCASHFQMPHNRFYSWHCHYPLNIPFIREGAHILTGKHDFSAFCNQKKNYPQRDFQRHITEINLEEFGDHRLKFVITGHSFHYQMVRNLVGTLIFIGRGKINLDELPNIIATGDRTLAGVSAPAHGLFLHKVLY